MAGEDLGDLARAAAESERNRRSAVASSYSRRQAVRQRTGCVVALGVLGGVVAVVGAGLLVLFLFAFDVGVRTPMGDRVANLDLMNQRTNGVIAGAAVLVVGVLMCIWAWMASSRRS